MFKWLHQYVIEVNMPLQEVWEFYMNPSNWSQWMDDFESCHFVQSPVKDSIVSAKIKNKEVFVHFLFTEIKPYQEAALRVSTLFFTQESLTLFQEISLEKTQLTFNTTVKSIFVPFLKSYFLKKCATQYLNCLRVFEQQAKHSKEC
jgi:hypothetical protein